MALKQFMNVLFGYTGASWTGRMPCSEIADAVVSTARKVLLTTIQKIEGTMEWYAEVIYGDTDSVFVRLKGRSEKEAFELA